MEKITKLVNEKVEMSEKEVSEFINADWPEGEEHTEWLEKASDKEIAEWVIAGQ